MTDREVMEALLAGKTLVSGSRLAWKMVDGALLSPDRLGVWGKSTYSWLGLDDVAIKPDPEPVDWWEATQALREGKRVRGALSENGPIYERRAEDGVVLANGKYACWGGTSLSVKEWLILDEVTP